MTTSRWAVMLAIAGCGRGGADGTRRSWDGKTTLTCSGRDVVSLVDCKVDLPGKVAISAGNGCQIKLERCTISAETVVSASNSVKITLIDTALVGTKQGLALWNSSTADVHGGRIEGKEAAIYAVNHVQIALAGTTVVGPIQRMNDSAITGVPEIEREQAAERIANTFGNAVCELAYACYGRGYLGAVAGRFAVELDATGVIKAATFDGDAPAAAKECLTSVGTKQLPGFTGPPGRLECAYAGQIGPSSFEVDRTWTFVPIAERE